MTRTIVGMEFKDVGLGPTSDRCICMEQAVLLSGRLAARLFHARLLVGIFDTMYTVQANIYVACFPIFYVRKVQFIPDYAEGYRFPFKEISCPLPGHAN